MVVEAARPQASRQENPPNDVLDLTQHPAPKSKAQNARARTPNGTTEGDLITIMFEDIAASTANAEKVGDQLWLELIRSHNAVVREQVSAHGGREVADRGDGFMVAFSSPSAAVYCAVAIQKAFKLTPAAFAPARARVAPIRTPSLIHGRRPRRAGGQGTEVLIQVHIGLHSGHPAEDKGNLYGTDVNLAARIADHVAKAGQIVVSSRLRDLLGHETNLAFGDPITVELKGLSGQHSVSTVCWN